MARRAVSFTTTLRWRPLPSGVLLLAALAMLASPIRPHSGVEADEVAAVEGPSPLHPLVRSVFEFPSVLLPGGSGGVPCGGISDLFPGTNRGGAKRLWAITDRGPNGKVTSAGVEHRTLLAPDFSPTLIEVELPWPAAGSRAPERPESLRLVRVQPLSGRSGRPVSGRPSGSGNEPTILLADGVTAVESDPDGVDTEGVVRTPDGEFWICEEYRPSLLHVSAEGRVLRRLIPAGDALADSDTHVSDPLPPHYRNRQDNRGFESLAIAPDASIVWTMVQSPLDHPGPFAGKATGNVRILGVDTRSGRPVGEHLYRLGDPAGPSYRTGIAAPDDGKICAMVAESASTLLVLEQSDDSSPRLYRCALARSSNLLDAADNARAPEGMTWEQVGDLQAVGVRPVEKVLVADLADVLPTMAAQADARVEPSKKPLKLKLEGLAILDGEHVAIANDNDFDLDGMATGGPLRVRSCLWVVHIPGAGFAVSADGTASAGSRDRGRY